MTIFQAVILAVIQGLTEFLPVSSSGHLVLFQKLFQLPRPPVLFDVLLHFGTQGAVFFFFRREFILLVKEWKRKKDQWLFLVVGTFPVAIVGFFLNDKIDKIFNSLCLLGIAWVSFGVLLLSNRCLVIDKLLERKRDDVGWFDALVIGFFQVIALLPGVSRSGSTILGGIFRKFSKESAFYLSFLLSVPAILGATVLKLSDGNLDGIGAKLAVFSVILSGIVGFFSLKFLQRVLKSGKFYLFGFYCLVLGIFVLLKFGSR